MNTVLDSFLKEHFQGLKLTQSLLSSWDNTIRFKMGTTSTPTEESRAYEISLQRAIYLFERVFEDQDGLLLVTDVYSSKDSAFLHRKPLDIYLKYIQHRRIFYKLKQYLQPYIVESTEEEKVLRFIIPCRKGDIRYKALLKALLYKDLTPSPFMDNNQENEYDIYLINHRKKKIFHLRNDHDCKILAANKEDLRSLYDECSQWIEESNQKEMDHLFK